MAPLVRQPAAAADVTLGAPPIETRDVSMVDLARRIAFIFNEAAREVKAGGSAGEPRLHGGG
jgi:hypothetical protein